MRDQRGCPLPRTEGPAMPEGPPSCPVLNVEAWYYTAADEARWRQRGWITEPPSYGRAILIEVLEQEATRVAREQTQRQSEMERSRARAQAHTGVRR